MRYLCVHSHCYQPPRENPWLEAVELQDSAYPYHDWNERIMAECYAPNTAARILGAEKRILKIVNNYAHTSYNFGPTLLSWMKDKAPEGYASILDADRFSAERFSGHGSALAQCYNHMIMPLANASDKFTQVYWGIKDFEYRFGRLPEGMWLPETAVDLETLDIMAGLDIRFTILAPSQAKSVDGEDVNGSRIDPTRAYFVKLPSGRTMNLFFYDGPVSQAVAFEHLLDDGEKFANRLLNAFSDGRDWPQLVHIATDGETYGHHHRYGEMALAYALHHIESKGLARLTNYGEYLEMHPPRHEVQIHENTAWSCVHGLGRWSVNCGCNSGSHNGWNQEWRAPLRAALDWLRNAVCPYFESEASRFLYDPWAARNDYIDIILDRSPSSRAAFKKKHFRRHLNQPEQVRVWKLLEMQRHAMLMYTSCGWFFDELSGIETVQVIQYAARVVQIAHELFIDHFEDGVLEKLAEAKSNIPEHRDGAVVYEKFVVPSMVNLYKVGAHYAISSLFQHYDDHARIYSYSVDREQYRTLEAGKMRIAIGKARFTSEVTQKSEPLTFGVLHFGEHNVHAGVRPFVSAGSFDELLTETAAAFARADLSEAVRVMDRAFGTETYSLKDLFRDEQRNAVDEILKSTLREAESAYRQLYGNHAPLLRFLVSCQIPLPREMRTTAEYAINSLLRSCLSTEDLALDRIDNLIEEARIAGVKLDTTMLEFTLRRTIERLSDRFVGAPRDLALLRKFEEAVDGAQQLPFPLVLWSIQNKCYEILQQDYPEMLKLAGAGDEDATIWIEHFRRLAELLSLQVPSH
jgi:alpha-amylase/alpha-mannosidase (GH57 family)